MGHLTEAQSTAKWQAEGDAETLTRAKAIALDPERTAAAEKAAKRLAKEAEERAELQKDSSKAMKDLSKGVLSYPRMKKRAQAKKK